MTAAERTKLLALAEAYKEHIYTKLLKLLPQRLGSIDRQPLRGLSSEEVMSRMYAQGVAEALDAFKVEEVLQALEAPPDSGTKA